MSEFKGFFETTPCQKLDEPRLNPPAAKTPTGFVRSFYGILLRRNWLDATFHFCKSGAYDSLLVNYLEDQSTPFTFVDIGANQGLYTILAAQNKFCAKVYAFEPVANTFSLLNANLNANKVNDKVQAIQAAVSLETGRTEISKKPWHSGAATMRKLPRWFRFTETISTIGPTTLQALIPFTADLIIKVDVEGHERVVFDTLVASGLLHNTKAVFYEINDRWSKADVLKTLLCEHGFKHFVYASSHSSCDVLASR